MKIMTKLFNLKEIIYIYTTTNIQNYFDLKNCIYGIVKIK